MFDITHGYVEIRLDDPYDRRKVDKAEWDSCREFEILSDSLSCLDAESIRFLKLIVGQFYVLHWRDNYNISVLDVCRAMRVSPEEAIRIMFRSYAKISKVKIVNRRKRKGTKYFYIEEQVKPLLASIHIYDADDSQHVITDYRAIPDLPVSTIRRLVMELPMPAHVLIDYDEFVRELYTLLPAVMTNNRSQANPGMTDDSDRYNTDKSPILVC